METFKRVLGFLLGGAVIGDVAGLLFGRSFIPWYQTPGAGSAMCNCVEVAQQVIGDVVRYQLIGTAVGAVLGVVAGILFARRRKPAPPPAATA